MTPKVAPSVVILSGPNGAGKTTAAPFVLRDTLAIEEFVNADQIAAGLSGFNPGLAAFEAGRVMLHRLHELAGERRTFAFETTLASRSFAPFIAKLLSAGYEFHLIYLWLDSPERALTRVASRVAAGGHDVSPDVVRRRYVRGLHNFFSIYRPLANSWRLYDNSANYSPQLIARGSRRRTSEVQNSALWNEIRGGI